MPVTVARSSRGFTIDVTVPARRRRFVDHRDCGCAGPCRCDETADAGKFKESEHPRGQPGTPLTDAALYEKIGATAPPLDAVI